MREQFSLPQELVRSLLHYDPETGVFTWTKDGSVAGSVRDKRGYLRIGIGGQRFHAHRLAFIWMTGACPPYVDHIDGSMGNNKWANLRAATKSQNGMNRGLPKNNTTGYKGVYWQANGYVAEIWVEGKKHYLGRYPTAEGAAHVATAARSRLHGEFARAI